ncbi:outer membrane beta-barrel protein [Helicobacter sp. T3_23-1056]
MSLWRVWRFCWGGGISIAAPAQKPPKEAKDSASGFFLGAELGYSAIFQIVDDKDATTNQITKTTRTDNFALGNIGAKLGYTHFFNKWVGLRGYASYTYAYGYTNNITKTPASGTTAATPSLNSHHQVAANVDVAFKFFDVNGVGLGAFVGIGAGYATTNNTASTTDEATNTTTTTTTNTANGFVLPVNAGLEVYMGKHHNASLNFRIPTLATTLTTTDTANGTTTKNELRNLIITLGYSYTF